MSVPGTGRPGCQRSGVGNQVSGAWGRGAMIDLFGEGVQVPCGGRESVRRCTTAVVGARMTRVTASGEPWMDWRAMDGSEIRFRG